MLNGICTIKKMSKLRRRRIVFVEQVQCIQKQLFSEKLSIVFARHAWTLGRTTATMHTIRKRVRFEVGAAVIYFSIYVGFFQANFIK